MTEFKVGDRVRLSPTADSARREALGDAAQGTITKRHAWGPTVHWDTPRPDWDGPEWHEVELVTANEPRGYTPADLRTTAATLRNKREVLYGAIDELRAQIDSLEESSAALERTATILEQNS